MNAPTVSPPTVPVKILGFSLLVPQTYRSGHVCSAAEASALNKVLTKGISKGLYKVLAAGLRPTGYTSAVGVPAEIARDIQERGEKYVADFILGFANGHDNQRALLVEISRVARMSLESSLNAQGKRLSDLSELEQSDALARLCATPRVQEEARRRLSVTKEIASRAHDELLESLDESEADEEGSGC